MPAEEQRLKMKIVIEIDAKKTEDIGSMIDNAVDAIKFGSPKGNGTLLGGLGSYTYVVEDNLPRKPMTTDTLFDMFNQQREPGTPTIETIMDLTMAAGDEAAEWWQNLSEQERYQWLTTHEGISTPLQAWLKHSRG
jgi:hypothetical protein